MYHNDDDQRNNLCTICFNACLASNGRMLKDDGIRKAVKGSGI
jgi:hypothetical protein